ncbi:UDP-3-O-acyl-N-acetylglucosamine deacetylase [Roseomonas xinghualingensis]|uniref:UDP-3-O-acyl-N-acetylglucosamine deacetylase n=1 Tax=Roseomonas xinghualingensis TaxID=2986475 RepID=UPI0021F2187E|nr:UDP-3-O-acyl-N-acetylglucosamine deacetylase [Roseomonas sp. SXEYE001]MCV4207443.1 UDP-3-O-acyl-N-acetylglucosamine deacetylase [Roseomonas sp. SXEYE001]
MDGFFPIGTARARTLKSAIGCVGVGLHSGARATLTLRPAEAGHGVVFRRTDLGVNIPALYDAVSDTRLCTAIGQGAERIGTIEHVMAALAACSVTDAVIEVDGPEIPILDGSAAPFIFLLDCAGLIDLPEPAHTIEVLRTVRVSDGEGPDAAWAELSPSEGPGFEAELSIDFGATAIGRQRLSMKVTEDSFRAILADARTFTMAEDIARLRSVGLARGGSLANAVVVDGPLVVNPGGLRHADEFVRHKLLDAVGDLALAGAPLRARFRGHRSGHALNNRLLRALFADPRAWRLVGEMEEVSVTPGANTRLPMAAAAA